jgi:hypothetical protein
MREMRNTYKIVFGKPEGKVLFLIPKNGWKD